MPGDSPVFDEDPRFAPGNHTGNDSIVRHPQHAGDMASFPLSAGTDDGPDQPDISQQEEGGRLVSYFVANWPFNGHFR